MECKEDRWGDLDGNLLRKIFQSMSAKELWSSVSKVCRQWRSVCWDILFWNDDETLELSTLRRLLGGPIENFYYFQELNKAVECMMYWVAKMDNHHGRCVRSIIFAADVYVSGRHLAFVAVRSPKLKRLVLPKTYSIKLSDVSKAITKWRELEELSIGPIQTPRPDHLLRTIGSNCENFTKLHIFGPRAANRSGHFMLDEYNASIIAHNLQQLKEFNIDRSRIFKVGVVTLLLKSKSLEKLNLKLCCGVVDPYISLFIPIPLKYLNDSISAKITRKMLSAKNITRKMHGHGVVHNFTKYWSIVSDSINGTWTADELADRIWAK